MAKGTGQRATLLREIEAHDRELARDMREANVRTMRAVAATARALRDQHRAGANVERLLSTAWRRPPKKALRAQITTKIARGRVSARRRTSGTTTTVHFRLGLTHSGSAARSHQRYIERDGAAVASFGNLADDARERARVWEAIEARTRKRKGVVKTTAGAPEALKRALVERLDRYVEEGRIPRGAAEAIRRKAREEEGLDGVEIGLASRDRDDHQALLEELWALGGESERARKARHRRNTRERPAGVHAYDPRAGIVQRRLVLELPHEVTPRQRERCLREWCETHLGAGGVAYHATIHQPEAGNDARNWHAHVVFTQFSAPRRDDGTGFAFEDAAKLPKLTPMMRRLSGNTKQKRLGVRELIKEWRKGWCDVLNRALAEGGHERRYDPRSYADQGVNREAGQHRGPERTRLEENAPEGATHWERDAPEWASITRAWGEHVRGKGGDEEAVTAHVAHLERIRMMSGLAAQGIGRDDPVTRTLAEGLDPERVAGESSTLESLEEALRETERGLEPAWLAEWRTTEREGLARDARGRAARSIAEKAGGITVIERWSASGAGAPANDLLAAARAHQASTEEWGARASAALAGQADEEERDARAAQLARNARESGHALEALLEAATAEEIATRGARQRRREAAREAREQIESRLAAASDPESVARGAASLIEEHIEYWTRDAPHEGEALRRWTEAAQGAARLRNDFRRACAGEGEGRIIEVAGRLRAEDERTKAAVTLLSEAEIGHMQSSARSEEETRREQRRIGARASEMMAGLVDERGRARTGAIGRIIACWEDEALKGDLAKGAPEGLAYLERAFRRVEQRRLRVRERLATMGENGESAAVVWTADPECLTLCADAAQRAEIEARAERWGEAMGGETRQRAGEEAKAHQRRVASMLGPEAMQALAALGSEGARAAARAIEKASEDERHDTEATRASARNFEARMTGRNALERRRVRRARRPARRSRGARAARPRGDRAAGAAQEAPAWTRALALSALAAALLWAEGALAISAAEERGIIGDAVRLNADKLSGGAIGIAIAMKNVLAGLSFVALLGIAAQGYFGSQGRGFNVPWLSSALGAVALVGLAGAVAGYLVGGAGFEFEADVQALDDAGRDYTGWDATW